MLGPQYLLLEVANSVLVSVGEEIEDVVFDVVLLQVVHQVGSVALEFEKFRWNILYIDSSSVRPEVGVLNIPALNPVSKVTAFGDVS